MIIAEVMFGLKETNLIELNKGNFENILPPQKDVELKAQTLRKQVQVNLQQDCQAVYKFFHHKTDLDNDPKSLKVAKTFQLGANVEEKVAEYQNLKITLKKLVLKEKKLSQDYFKSLLQNASILKDILEKYKIQLKPEKDKIACKSLVSRIDALLTKIERIISSTRLETYTEDNISILKETYNDITREITEKKLQIASLKHQLQGYTVLGDEYEHIVKEYSKIQADINKNNWVLDAFNNPSTS